MVFLPEMFYGLCAFELSHSLYALALFLFGDGGVVACAPFLYCSHNLEAAVMAYLLHSTYCAAALVHDYVKGPGCCGGAYEYALFAFVKRNWNPLCCLAHHSVDNAVEQKFKCAGNVAPITRGTYDDGVAAAYLLEYSL